MKDNRVFIRHILDEIAYIIKETGSLSYEDLLKNETLKKALIRSLEVIGEASKNIPDDFKKAHPEIEWRELAGLRDKLIHFYFGVDWKVVWDVIKNKIPGLDDKINRLL